MIGRALFSVHISDAVLICIFRDQTSHVTGIDLCPFPFFRSIPGIVIPRSIFREEDRNHLFLDLQKRPDILQVVFRAHEVYGTAQIRQGIFFKGTVECLCFTYKAVNDLSKVLITDDSCRSRDPAKINIFADIPCIETMFLNQRIEYFRIFQAGFETLSSLRIQFIYIEKRGLFPKCHELLIVNACHELISLTVDQVIFRLDPVHTFKKCFGFLRFLLAAMIIFILIHPNRDTRYFSCRRRRRKKPRELFS